ncbi:MULTISPECIES: large-conductance mechanosensitive channel protein MscL [unclassified Exiguobacterium]|uniref:large-conductance mechanosensitive channel protein MscL n=1 Tax=unclassified Exiguobacterium TaxID=2644629 RepID=UPI00103AA6C3|nr:MULTISPECIES: large-conductance mechanosensitive channel protein MscL [unclassified Exiguobacterium]TCI71357.1 large-conductance mechanosensitive channel protein MscL [Exiguobacterium sp. IPCI3]TCI81335.1 large-conductance mechanosensitive channel protein MscL [Exiguobacterium sp. IPCH1]TCI82532.1 large-conductance mechanosensitive channel protein MscL [Exiguobacterium sp. IPBC4]
MWKEFKEFAIKGNVIDLAVAFILGAAFTAIVTSLVNDIFMPFLGILIGGIDFSTLAVSVLGVKVTYGNFLQEIVKFFLIAFALFMMVKVLNRLKREKAVEETPEPELSREEQLLSEIRDLLKERS